VVGIGYADDREIATRTLPVSLSAFPARLQSHIYEASAATKVGVAGRGSMGTVEILLLVALVVYLFGDDIGQRSHP
jgi:hypothetical protein